MEHRSCDGRGGGRTAPRFTCNEPLKKTAARNARGALSAAKTDYIVYTTVHCVQDATDVDPGWCDKLDAVAKKVNNIFPKRVEEGFKTGLLRTPHYF